MRIHLGARLATVLSLIEGGESLVDVGTDHGKLPVAALLSGKVSRATATDISEKSLNKAKLLAEKEGVSLHCLVGDGLKPVREKADVVVIAGMGGAEIVKILREAPCRHRNYILVPHKNAALVRGYLKEENACILRDIAVKEKDHFYFVIQATFALPWRAHSLYFGEEGEAAGEYGVHRLEKLEWLLSRKEDPSLREEKEELTDAQALGNRENA